MIDCLYDNYKNWSSDGSVYIISDPHFDDEDCRLMSPDWISPEEQIKKINSLVHSQDTLVILGDVGNIERVPQLNGYHVLIMGNHDVGATKYKREDIYTTFNTTEEANEAKKNGEIDEWFFNRRTLLTQGYKDNGLFDEVYEGALFISQKILLSHEPIMLPFATNIHGHVHNGVFRYTNDYGCNCLNLAANVCGYTPISLGAEIKKGLLSKTPSIHRLTIDKAIERKSRV